MIGRHNTHDEFAIMPRVYAILQHKISGSSLLFGGKKKKKKKAIMNHKHH